MCAPDWDPGGSCTAACDPRGPNPTKHAVHAPPLQEEGEEEAADSPGGSKEDSAGAWAGRACQRGSEHCVSGVGAGRTGGDGEQKACGCTIASCSPSCRCARLM